jgi:FkbM family methyltransferase
MCGQNHTLSMVVPDWRTNPYYPGAQWYQSAWDSQKFNPGGFSGSMGALENAMDYAPCTAPVRVRSAADFKRPIPYPQTTATTASSLYFLQVGAHLGAFPLMAATYGCRVVAVDAYPPHARYMEATACINGLHNFRVLDRAIDEVSDKELWFDEGQAHLIDDARGTHERAGMDGAEAHRGKRRVLTVAIDDVVARHATDVGSDPLVPTINTVVVDVEGFEQSALLGASKLIESRQVLFWQIEVWASMGDDKRWKDPARYHGLSRLIEHGYGLFLPHHLMPDPNRMEPLSLKELLGVFDKICPSETNCIHEVLAVHPVHIKSWLAAWDGARWR